MPETCRSAREDIEDRQYQNGVASFYPLDDMRRYLTKQKVKEILTCDCVRCREHLTFFRAQTEPEDYVVELLGGVHGPYDLTHTYFSIFALLVYIEHPILIIGFIDSNCNDYILEAWATKSSNFSPDSLQHHTGRYRNDVERFARFARKFTKYLPEFAVPHMDSSKFSQYDANVILPFIEERQIGQKLDDQGHLTSEGANGKVYAFKIHKEYCKFQNASSRRDFARKRIETSQPEAFLERSNIEYVQRFGNPHIVKLLKAYGHGDSINLILPLAWTNLDHLIRDPKYRYAEKRGAKLECSDAWVQLLGIARALKQIQGFGDGADSKRSADVPDRLCIHFDLKPDNILVERNGTWVITDFGQAALTRRRRGTTPRVGGHFGTDAYAPPEIDDTGMDFGRAYDIWSLGCIILEVTAFLVLGYVGLTGSTEFQGLDQAREAKIALSRHEDSRFFYRESSSGRFVVKTEICNFITDLQERHSRSRESSNESKVFLGKIIDLIHRMLQPNVADRVTISRVVDVLSSAIKHASAGPTTGNTLQIVPSPGEFVLGGLELNQIKLWHWSEVNKEWQDSSLDAFESDSGIMRLHPWMQGCPPSDIIFRRTDVKIIPLYAFWDPKIAYDSRAWIQFLFMTTGNPTLVSNAMFSFDGNSGLKDARTLQSKLTSQHIEASFSLSKVRLNKPDSLRRSLKNRWRKMTSSESDSTEKYMKSLEFSSATIQIWIEEEHVAMESLRRQSTLSHGSSSTRAARQFLGDRQELPTRRVAIYLHQQRFVCTVKIDVNWVLDKDNKDTCRLRFVSHHADCFYASWLRPTQEELDNDYPAGIPLHPKTLQHHEDLDCFEVESFEIWFLSPADLESFYWDYQGVKKDWNDQRMKLGKTLPVNRMPENAGRAQDLLDTESQRLSRKKTPLSTLSPRKTMTGPYDPNSTASSSQSKHDSKFDENMTINPNNPIVHIG